MITWQAFEFIQYKRSQNWYILLVIIALTLAALAFIFQYWTSLVLVFLALPVIWLRAKKEPRKITFTLSEEGLGIDKNFHPFSDLQSFWILDAPDEKQLVIRQKKALGTRLEIPLGEQDKKQVRDFLITYLPEKEEEESFITILARILKI